MSPLSSIDTTLLFHLFFSLSTMSDIYCHEDVIDFTNPFLDFDQGYQAPRKIATVPVSPKTVLLCHDFHQFTHFLRSSKRPNTHSNHDMALSYLTLSYLILSYLIFSHFKVTPSRRRKQIVLEYRQRTIYLEEAATTHSFSLSDSPIPSKSNSSSASSPPCGQVLS